MFNRQTRASSDISHLTVQQVGLGGRGRGTHTGSRSRTPSPNPAAGAVFFPQSAANLQQEDGEEVFADAESVDKMNDLPIPAEATLDQVRQIAEQARQETRNMRANQDRMTAAVEQATAAAAAATAALQALALSVNGQAAAPTQTHRRKRPELPPFDKNNIHIWVQRIEAAYAREEITDPKQKFAFLESVIGVNMGPTINGYMFGAATTETWKSFIDHLLETFGPTKEQRCSTFLDGVSRDGRRPSDLLALIRDKGKDVSIDDLQKQLVLRGLPPDVRKLLQDKIEDLNATETANLADAHFDKEGRPLNSSSGINNVSAAIPNTFQQQHFDPPADTAQEESGDINAVNRQGRRPPRGGPNNGNNRYTPAFGSSSTPRGARSNSRPRHQPPRPGDSPAENVHNQQEEFSTCRIHSRDANSRVCAGPKCPSHGKATSCLHPSCRTHAKGGNGRGGRRRSPPSPFSPTAIYSMRETR